MGQTRSILRPLERLGGVSDCVHRAMGHQPAVEEITAAAQVPLLRAWSHVSVSQLTRNNVHVISSSWHMCFPFVTLKVSALTSNGLNSCYHAKNMTSFALSSKESFGAYDTTSQTKGGNPTFGSEVSLLLIPNISQALRSSAQNSPGTRSAFRIYD